MKKTALILIDIQNIYFTEGAYLLFEPELAGQQAKKVLEEFRSNGLPVVHVKHVFHTENYKEDSEYLNEIHAAVFPAGNEKIIMKQHPNCFWHTDLLEYLQSLEITDLVVLGMMSHMCVDTTVRACQDYGYQVTVIDDACTTKPLSWKGKEMDASSVHNVYMAGLSGLFAEIMSAEEFISQM